MTTWVSVGAVRGDLAGVLVGFRGGNTLGVQLRGRGAGVVVLTYDEFEDLGGESKPVVWGEDGEPAAVLLSTAQYRDLCGDDHPPAAVVDDPTVRVYATEPLPGSRPLNLDEWAADDPLTRELLDEIRAE